MHLKVQDPEHIPQNCPTHVQDPEHLLHNCLLTYSKDTPMAICGWPEGKAMGINIGAS